MELHSVKFFENKLFGFPELMSVFQGKCYKMSKQLPLDLAFKFIYSIFVLNNCKKRICEEQANFLNIASRNSFEKKKKTDLRSRFSLSISHRNLHKYFSSSASCKPSNQKWIGKSEKFDNQRHVGFLLRKISKIYIFNCGDSF